MENVLSMWIVIDPYNYSLFAPFKEVNFIEIDVSAIG